MNVTLRLNYNIYAKQKEQANEQLNTCVKTSIQIQHMKIVTVVFTS